APAVADQKKPKPSARELLRAYPLEPTATATAARTPVRAAATATPASPARAAATATPAVTDDGGGAPLLPIALAVLAGGGARAPAPPAAAPRPTAAQRLRDAAGPALDRTAERLRDAAAIRRAREWPWPAGSEDLWRCEIAPDPASLSAHFRAVVHPPGGA